MNAATYASAATTFADLVRRIPAAAWTGPGLGEWNLRDLVGHASRSLVTVSTYLRTPLMGGAEDSREDVTSAADYYVQIRDYASTLGAADVAERGRQAGRDLGADPAAAVDALVQQALSDVAAADDPLIQVIGGLRIRLGNYLPTRTFELAVHGLDIARASGVALTLPEDVLTEAATLAARIAVRTGDGDALLLAMTGRVALPDGFSVV